MFCQSGAEVPGLRGRVPGFIRARAVAVYDEKGMLTLLYRSYVGS